MNILKNIGAVLLAVVVGNIIIYSMHLLGHAIYPLPEGVDMNNSEQLAAYIPKMPLGALLMVLLAHQAGSFAGSILACGLRRKSGHVMRIGWVVGGLFLVFGVLNLFMLPHPVWFAVVDTLLYIPVALVGARLVMPKE